MQCGRSPDKECAFVFFSSVRVFYLNTSGVCALGVPDRGTQPAPVPDHLLAGKEQVIAALKRFGSVKASRVLPSYSVGPVPRLSHSSVGALEHRSTHRGAGTQRAGIQCSDLPRESRCLVRTPLLGVEREVFLWEWFRGKSTGSRDLAFTERLCGAQRPADCPKNEKTRARRAVHRIQTKRTRAFVFVGTPLASWPGVFSVFSRVHTVESSRRSPFSLACVRRSRAGRRLRPSG